MFYFKQFDFSIAFDNALQNLKNPDFKTLSIFDIANYELSLCNAYVSYNLCNIEWYILKIIFVVYQNLLFLE